MIKLVRFYNRVKLFLLGQLLSGNKWAERIGIEMGTGCYITTKLTTTEPYLVKLGNNVRLARDVEIFTHGGVWLLRRLYPDLADIDYFGKVTLGDNVYVGTGAIILPGVTIENNCIIGAYSVVTKSVPENSFVAGNPARYISTVDAYAAKFREFNIRLHGKTLKEKKKLLLDLPDDAFRTKPYMKIPHG